MRSPYFEERGQLNFTDRSCLVVGLPSCTHPAGRGKVVRDLRRSTMGVGGSNLQGKARVAPPLCLLGLTAFRRPALDSMWRRFRGMGSVFALDQATFGKLLEMDKDAGAMQLFLDIFDTDANGLVDAYEVMAGLALASQMTKADKVREGPPRPPRPPIAVVAGTLCDCVDLSCPPSLPPCTDSVRVQSLRL